MAGRQKKSDPPDPLDEPIICPDPLTVAFVANSYRHSPAAQAAIHRKAEDIVEQQLSAKFKLQQPSLIEF
jgi:hypothetical protein